ncbi:response regulator transcription factor [Dellaglioa algida]|uniref:OmpR family DNA-binding response regulator n=2 Tax=Dellaglioa algida TaxID=105612 RepID=A0A0R1HSY8_9LACO|nr:response regulator transcription factor [Dellaglioa algida]KRK46362.1 OmpR family DNA-binding response regulator [Dellaglioa algida DSM 15638]MDK1716365.1 response regulator transcription factor [Dellaglioa algida]MDK1720281.1 response regulator transcription factor [Dellaglioa algida]MDK1721306.1 response regulator transcription factor [Dellaglioa algida]MDK1723422.1 response regulator transcription factor [Dellaglioa algida]
MPRGLIIEDDTIISANIVEATTKIMTLEQAFDGEEGLFKASQNIYDIIILDLMLPKISGFDVLKKIREYKIDTAVLILSAKDSVHDKIDGFNLGADDYLAKPFNLNELQMRIKALLKRTMKFEMDSELKYKDMILSDNRTIISGDQSINLPGKEYEFLTYLLENKNTILTKEQIFDRVWGFTSDTSITVVEVYMSNIRKKLKIIGYEKMIRTIRNVGYLVESDEK